MRRLQGLAKAVLATALHRTYALPVWGAVRRQLVGVRVHVLAFHRVVDDLDALPDGLLRPLCVRTATFERICRFAARRFEVLPLVEAAAVLAGRRAARRDVLTITFDDGYRDVYLRALPVLQRYRLPATAFIPTGLIGSPVLLEHDRLHALLHRLRTRRCDVAGRLDAGAQRALASVEPLLHRSGSEAALDALIRQLPGAALTRLGDALEAQLGAVVLDEAARVMSADELRRIAAGGVALGAHTIGHVALTHERADRVRTELEQPRRILEEISGEPCRAFAYCNGLWHPPLVDAVGAAGYEIAVTTRDAPNLVGQHPLLLGRKTIREGHAHASGALSDSLLVAHLHDLFGDLALTAPVDGRVAPTAETAP